MVVIYFLIGKTFINFHKFHLDDSSTFSLTNEENLITITLTNPLSPEDVETKEFFSFVIVATNPNSGVGETAVLISLPPKICEGMSTITDQITRTTTTSTSVETTESETTFSTLIDYENTTASTTEFTSDVTEETTDYTTAYTTVVDTELTTQNWNDTTVATTKGGCP